MKEKCIQEKLSVCLEYDKELGLSTEEFISYLDGLNNAYSRFSNKSSKLAINHVKEGSVIMEFIQTIVVPTLPSIVSNGVYDFGKHLIYSLSYAKNKTKFKELLNRSVQGEPEAINTTRTIYNITGDNATINQVTINVESDKNKPLQTTMNQSESRELSEATTPFIKALKKQDKKKAELYESVELSFRTVSEINSEGTYSGYVQSIDKSAKKVTFKDEDIKNKFDFEHDPFNKLYLVSINVHYNVGGSIGKYEITEFIDTLEDNFILKQ